MRRRRHINRVNRRRSGARRYRASVIMTTLNHVNDDCLVKIMSFLNIGELNDATLINSRFCVARNHSSLDQTRTATIVIASENMANILDLYETIASRGWTHAFAENSNNTRLKILGLQRLRQLLMHTYNIVLMMREQAAQAALPSVTCLDLSFQRNQPQDTIYYYDVEGVARLLPNLLEVDLSYVSTQSIVFSAMAGGRVHSLVA